MSDANMYLRNKGDSTEKVQMGIHTDIPSPMYIPEVKGAEGLRALLNHTDTLDEQNPITVPAAKWSWLRSKNEITTRTNEQGEEVGSQEIQELEEEHPLVFFDPPELYNYKRTKTLVNYLTRLSSLDKDEFERLLREGRHAEAQSIFPEFVQPFIHANINRVLEETEGAATVAANAGEIDSAEEAWIELEPNNYEGYFDILAEEASKVPSSIVIPPVPQFARTWNADLAEAWITANQKMAEAVEDIQDTDAYFHLYITPEAFDTDADRDTALEALQTLNPEVNSYDYAGIALTVYYPNRIWQTNRAARMETFVGQLSDIASEHNLPIISPRSEWFGSYATDLGIQGFSTMLNGAWEYRRYSSEGGPTGADRYGRTMIPNEARALKVRSNNNEDLEGYLSANGSLPTIPGLPDVPPTYDPSGSSLTQKFGTDAEFRRTFGKPRRLAHVREAEQFREDRSNGVMNPAKEYLETSRNPYIEI